MIQQSLEGRQEAIRMLFEECRKRFNLHYSESDSIAWASEYSLPDGVHKVEHGMNYCLNKIREFERARK